jgi:hypothetical protein
MMATWFVDPPYQRAGKEYIHAGDALDFPALGVWCRQRRGQALVCENVGADWLPFEPFMLAKAGPARRVSAEALWVGGIRNGSPCRD